jgi:hypothetical protein
MKPLFAISAVLVAATLLAGGEAGADPFSQEPCSG